MNARLNSLVKRSANTSARRFILAGLANTLVSFLTYCLCILAFAAPYWLANFAAMIAGICCGFVLSKMFVFTAGSGQNFAQGWRYVCTILVQYICSTTLIGLGVYVGISEILGYVLVLPAVIFLSYKMQKLWVFKAATL